MRKIFKYLVANTYKPLLVKYLSKTRTYFYRGIRLDIPPQVFHPAFFFSSKLLLRYIGQQNLQNKSLLELGAGSGLISFFAARRGADVTATDINPVAVKYLEKNRQINQADLKIIQSDMFSKIPLQPFDIIAINPPYYKKKPVTDADYAWCCGENGEYFEQLFSGLAGYMHRDSLVLLTLCDACDIHMVHAMAGRGRFHMFCVQTKQNVLEKNFILKIEKVS